MSTTAQVETSAASEARQQRSPAAPAFRAGCAADAPAIKALVDDNLHAGHLLPRTLADLQAHADRFLVATADDRLVGCAELAPLSLAVAEVRSLVVAAGWRGRGLGSALVDQLRQRARRQGFSTLCALTHDPSHFVRLGFSIVPHVWFPEKIAADCTSCDRFRRCGQFAVALPLAREALGQPAGAHREPIGTLRGTPVVPVTAPRVRRLEAEVA